MLLHSKSLGAGPPLLILHGLFGTLDNWQTLAKRFGESRRVHLLDLRNHGRSPHAETMSYADMAGDVAQWMDANGLEQAAVIGHSMGGKVAMQLALAHPTRVRSLTVVDMAPKAYDPGHKELFEAMLGLPLTTGASRGELDAILSERIPDAGVRLFLMKNLAREPSGYRWKLNLPVIYREYREVLRAIGGTPWSGPALFVRGGRSDYVLDADLAEVRGLFPAAELSTVAGAGHWVHAERPAELFERITDFLASAKTVKGR